jgi:nicotinamidase-related amidase
MNETSRISVRRALLLLDMQESICREDGEIGRAGMGAQVSERHVLERAAHVLAFARAHGFLVAYARVAFDDAYSTMTSKAPRFQRLRGLGLGRASSHGAAICKEVAPRAGELVVSKTGIGPLTGTPLLLALTAAGVSEIVIGGVATNHVVESCARHAADAGLDVVVLSDLCAAQTEELHRHSIEQTLPYYSTVIDSESYLATIGR